MLNNTKIAIYQTPDGQTSIDVKLEDETVWLSQMQMAKLFQKDRTVIGRHINNVFKEGELDREVVCANFVTTTQHSTIKGKQFAVTHFLGDALKQIEQMPESTFEEIADKYVEGNGRSMRIWLDLMLKKNLKKCVDWSKIGKADYMNAMVESATNSADIKHLLKNALTDEINSREMFMKGIDYSYYYEENE